jgi:hypothetical protein
MARTHYSRQAGTTKRRRSCVRIPLAEHGRIRRDAKRSDISMAEYCRRALIWYLANRKQLADPAVCRLAKSELAMIRKGEAAIARGESVSLNDFLHGVDRTRRKTSGRREE